MDYRTMYDEKKLSPQDAVSLIEDNSKMQTGGEPTLLLTALKEQRHRFHNLYVYSMLGLMKAESVDCLLDMEAEGHISYGVGFISGWESRAIRKGRTVDHLTAHFSQFEDLSERYIKPDYLLANVAPMDEEGYFALGYHPFGRSAVDAGAKAILQVNECMPALYSDYYKVHISEVTALCEGDIPITEFGSPAPSEIDQRIASHIIERIPDGATIQLGIGGVPGAVSNFLKDHKDLGIHTELFSNTMTMLMKSGVVNNSRKTLYPGVAVTGIVQGNQETYQFVNKNKDVFMKRLGWVNDPATIAQNKDMISINACMSVDLRGQVCSESLGYNISGGSGGQLDFVRGARKAEGGKSFIAMHSVNEKEGRDPISKIVLSLDAGSAVTCPRNDVQYIVTEYGVAELENRSAREKALNLIAVAHPDFRDRLLFDAKEAGYI
ncbi:MAG: 4-hydroxybutyrate--acetyl-CoA CoA transferase [Clostridiales bacterium]|nr:4-hydroxybutyrate--acetyl-CoA CoA transferase [Clostridiales bacterium]